MLIQTRLISMIVAIAISIAAVSANVARRRSSTDRFQLERSDDRFKHWLADATDAAMHNFSGVLGTRLSRDEDPDRIFASRLVSPGAIEANVWFFDDRQFEPVLWCIYAPGVDARTADQKYQQLCLALVQSASGWDVCEWEGTGEICKRSLVAERVVARKIVRIEVLMTRDGRTGRCDVSLQIGLD
jgi:hypothetical protein